MALASWRGHTDIVRILLEAGDKPDVQDQVTECVSANAHHMHLLYYCWVQEGLTPLILATQCGHANVAKTLLGGKADPNITDKV